MLPASTENLARYKNLTLNHFYSLQAPIPWPLGENQISPETEALRLSCSSGWAFDCVTRENVFSLREAQILHLTSYRELWVTAAISDQVAGRQKQNRTRTRTNKNPYGTEANAAGRSGRA